MTKTCREIINETVETYKTQPRAIKRNETMESNGCYYFLDGMMCAAGRCMVDPEAISKDPEVSGFWVDEAIEKYGDEVFKEEYRGHDPEFWRDIQRLHDPDENWNGGELTAVGQFWVEQLYEEWC